MSQVESPTLEFPGSPNTPPPKYMPKTPSISPPKSKSPEKSVNPKRDFETMTNFYLANNPFLKKDGKESELEIRFGTNKNLAKPLSKIEYDNVIKQFYSAGFQTRRARRNSHVTCAKPIYECRGT